LDKKEFLVNISNNQLNKKNDILDDLREIRTYKRTLVRDKSIPDRSTRSVSSLNFTGRQSLDKESIRQVKRRIQDDETSVVQMYYSNLESL